VRYRMIDRCREAFPVQMMCHLLGVSCRGYYDFSGHPPSRTAIENRALMEQIESLHERSDGVWGAPTITDELKIQGIPCSTNRVARLMRANRIQGIPQKRRWQKCTSSNHFGLTTS